MADLMVRGAVMGGAGTPSPFTGGLTGAQRTQDAHGKYVDAVLQNRVFGLSGVAGAATAYVGAAAGTPLLAIHNPLNSQKYIALLYAAIASRVAASAAGSVGFNIWGGVSAQPTGTQTVPRSMLTQSQAGSVALGFVNTALTGSTALNLLLPLWTYYWATAAGAIQSPGNFDIGGVIIIPPGNQIAIGATAALTSATYDFSCIWEEMPFLVQA